MSTPTTSPEFLLLARGSDWTDNMAPDQIQDVMSRFMGWMDQLTKDGKLKGAQPLEERGVVIGRGGRVVADGPFAESKEAVGGYFLLTVPTFEEAVEIARSCPTIDHGLMFEVRPIADMCPKMKQLAEEGKLVMAGV